LSRAGDDEDDAAPLKPVIDEPVERLAELATHKHLTVTVDVPETLKALMDEVSWAG